MITIASFDTIEQAELLKSALENAGIQTFVADGTVISLNWMYSNALGGIKVQINEEDISRARELFEEIEENSPFDDPLSQFECPRCKSTLFIALFVYFNFYRFAFKGHAVEYCKRVIAIYVFSLLVVGLILTIIHKCPWGSDNLLAVKRMLIVAFPASMSAAVSDTLK